MRRFTSPAGGLIAVLAAVLGFRTAEAQITVAVAANVQYALEEIRKEFQKENPKVEVKLTFGASGRFATQIRNGAPFDLFISADTDFPDSVAQWGLAATPPKVYGHGRLALWTHKGLTLDSGLQVLKEEKVKRIAIPDPKRAPYGKEAVKALKKAGIYAAVEKKIVTAENIAQVSQYVLTDNVDIGFTAKGVVTAPDMKDKGVWLEVDEALYDDIAQAAVICRYGADNNPHSARKFYDFLYGEKARAVLLRYGYLLPAAAAASK